MAKLAAECMQEPVNQTVKQVHIAFDAVLDILSLQEERATSRGLLPELAGIFEAFLSSTAMELMSLSKHPNKPMHHLILYYDSMRLGSAGALRPCWGTLQWTLMFLSELCAK